LGALVSKKGSFTTEPPAEPGLKPPVEPELDPHGTGNNPILPEELVRFKVTTKGRYIPKDVERQIEVVMEAKHPGISREEWEIAHPPAKPWVNTMEGEETEVFGQLKVLNQREAQKIGAGARKQRQWNKTAPPDQQIPIRPPRTWSGRKKSDE
jgi:hypothetical protein